MNELPTFSVGDTISLIKQSIDSNPPVGTVGAVRKLYTAGGGPAAMVDWNCDTKGRGVFFDRVFLRDIELVATTEIEESDADPAVLFGGVTAQNEKVC